MRYKKRTISKHSFDCFHLLILNIIQHLAMLRAQYICGIASGQNRKDVTRLSYCCNIVARIFLLLFIL
jgi:hypothetical protein